MPIYTRFAWLTLAITVVALGSATMLWNTSLQGDRRQELDERLLDFARILASELSDPRDRSRMNEFVRAMHRETRSRLTVIDIEGVVLAESNLEPDDVAAMENHLYRPEIQEALARGTGRAVRESPTLGIPMAYVAVRWGPSSAPFGVVRTALPMTHVVEEQTRGRGRLLLVVLASLLLAGVLGTVASRRISRPLAQLSAGARRIADGDLDRRLEIEGSVETRELAHAINHLAASVQSEITELDRERERLVQLLQNLPDGILVVDGDGRITLANRLARELLALDDDYEGRTPVEAVRSAELQQAVDRASGSGKTETVEIELTEPERRVLSVGMVQLATGLVIVFHDVTRLRRLEEARREMVANIGHELRTPLAAILGYLETLKHGEELPSAVRGSPLRLQQRRPV